MVGMKKRMNKGGPALAMKKVGGRSVPAFAADGKGANDILKAKKGGSVKKRVKKKKRVGKMGGGSMKKRMNMGGSAMKKRMKRGGVAK